MIKDQIIKFEDLATFHPLPGKIYSGLPNEIYHSSKSIISSSGAKTIDKNTIKHWQDEAEDNGETKSQSLGTEFHGAVESTTAAGSIEDYVYVVPDYAKNSTKPVVNFILENSPREVDRFDLMQEKINDLRTMASDLEIELAGGRKIVDQSTFEKAHNMAAALRDHPDVGMLFKMNGIAELSFYHEMSVKVGDQTVKVKVRVRPDYLIELKNEIKIIDWKSIGEPASEKALVKSIRKWGYDLSASMYCYVVSKFTDKPVNFYLVFAESFKPAKEKVQMMKVEEPDLDAGWDKFWNAMQKYASWKKTQGWAGWDLPEKGYHTNIVANRSDYYE